MSFGLDEEVVNGLIVAFRRVKGLRAYIKADTSIGTMWIASASTLTLALTSVSHPALRMHRINPFRSSRTDNFIVSQLIGVGPIM